MTVPQRAQWRNSCLSRDRGAKLPGYRSRARVCRRSALPQLRDRAGCLLQGERSADRTGWSLPDQCARAAPPWRHPIPRSASARWRRVKP